MIRKTGLSSERGWWALHTLEELGVLESRWVDGKLERKQYRLNTEGLSQYLKGE